LPGGILPGTSDTWFPAPAEGGTILDRVVNHRPAYAAAMREVEAAIWDQDAVEPAILELCRRRIAQLLGEDGEAPGPPAAGLDVLPSAALAQWPTAPGFSECQRICLGYAEQLLIDAQGVSDEQAARVIDAVGEGGFLVLTYACGFFETTQRARLLLSAGRDR
jgi:alkylhydroperoxidase family enzyme